MNQIANVPLEMRQLPNWLLWKLEDRGKDKPTKTPYSVRGGYAKTNDPTTWATFDEAWNTYLKGDYNGLGFCFTNTPYVGIDIDGVIEDGTAPKEIGEIIDQFNSYTEVSQSGTGFHIIVKGTLPEGRRRNGKFEMYGHGSPRYFAMTGDGNTKAIMECQDVIDTFHAQYIAAKAKEPCTDTGIPLEWDSKIGADNDSLTAGLERDERLRSLYNGSRPNGNESSDDLALMDKLAYWCNGDRALMEQAFFNSPHYTQKDEAHKKKCRRDDYIRRTIDEALSDLRSTAAVDNKRWQQDRVNKPTESHATQQQASINVPSLIKAADIPYEPPRWLIAPYFQRGKGALIQGDNGSGKTAFMCAVAAHISTGNPLLGIPVEAPGDVLILSVEDDSPILRGRIEASGGDLDKCHFMTNAAGLTFNSPEVEAAIKQINAKLVIFDPFQAFLGAHIRMSESNQTRPELAKLFEMCERNDCSCAIIAHMGKAAGDKSPVNRSLGSVDIPASMRSILQLTKNPEDEDERIMVHIKCSNAPKGRSIAYTIGDRGGVTWTGFNDMTPDDLNAIIKRKEKGIPYENEPLVQVFNQLISDKPGGGFWSYADLKKEGAKVLGCEVYSSITDLRQRLDNGLSKEMLARDGLLITHGEKGRGNVRGIRIEQYQHPKGYQTKIQDG